MVGTLFERSYDPAKRSQQGAFYTQRGDIDLIIEPVVMQPLRREWTAAQAQIEALRGTGAQAQINALIDGMLHRLATIRVLDPAAGTGNFLFVALQTLKDMERSVVAYALGVGWLPARLRR